ncbi:MAG: hypothetical protein R3F51_07345 [Cyanobacteriota/Melainabacteria group bacterium]
MAVMRKTRPAVTIKADTTNLPAGMNSENFPKRGVSPKRFIMSLSRRQASHRNIPTMGGMMGINQSAMGYSKFIVLLR